MTRSARHAGSREGGFTLLEIVVAATILTIVVAFTYQLLGNTVKGQDMIREGLKSPKIQNTILQQILRDFRYLYYVDFAGGGGFVGKKGRSGAQVDFVTARRTRIARAEDTGERDPGESPLTEVGYALRRNEKVGEWFELHRREDFFVDDNPTEGGEYSLVYDKIRSFDLQYYPDPRELGPDPNAKGQEEWDSRIRKAVPYAIVVSIKFDVDEPPSRDNPKEPESITRIILLRAGAEDSVQYASTAADAAMQPGGM